MMHDMRRQYNVVCMYMIILIYIYINTIKYNNITLRGDVGKTGMSLYVMDLGQSRQTGLSTLGALRLGGSAAVFDREIARHGPRCNVVYVAPVQRESSAAECRAFAATARQAHRVNCIAP